MEADDRQQKAVLDANAMLVSALESLHMSVKELIVSLVVKNQVSLFVPFQPFTTAPDSFRGAFERFFPSGYFPGTVQEQTPGAPLAERMSLVSNGTGINVHFLSNRIDFLMLPLMTQKPGLPIAEFCEEVTRLSTVIREMYDIRVERMAIISERMVDNLDLADLERARKAFIAQGLGGFDEVNNIEWSVRQAIRAPLTDDDKTLCNHIYSVSRGTAQVADPTGARTFEALQVALDINSHPIPGLTFNTEGVAKFITNSLIAHEKLLSIIESRIHER